MDAFSVAIAYGTNKIKIDKTIIFSILIGIFHFFMPIIGSVIGLKIQKIVPNIDSIVGLVFLVLAIQMFITRNDSPEIKKLDILSILIVALSVSIDSFTIGIGFGILKDRIILPAIIFSLTSSLISFIGLILGNKLNNKLGNKAIYIGIIILIIISLKYLY